jgi:HD-GYP domain-containing protein (c-di-GMP phosphodiesterase class II)
LLNYKVQVAIEELRLGMYVVELDRPWIGTNFAFQGFPLESEDQLEQLRFYCKSVYVDPARGAWAPEKRCPLEALKGSTNVADKVPVEKELPVAQAIYESCEGALKDLLSSIRVEGEIDSAALTGAMTSTVRSIQRSPDAMLLLNAVRRKDSYELTRAMDTSILMVTFGRFLQFPEERLEVLGLAGMLLDVGMTELPDDAVAAFNSEDAVDSGLIETHVMHSVELIRSARGLPPRVDEVVALHHERYDGEGYPYGLSADQISMDGAIAALVDSYSRLTSTRPHAGQLSPSAALNVLHKQRGQTFDEKLVEQFIQCIGVYPVGGAVELNTGELAIVIAHNPTRRLQPRVSVVLDANGNPLRPQKMLDLMKDPKTPDDEPYRIRKALPKDGLNIDPNDFLV